MKNDVYKFRYSEEYTASKKPSDLYHCFDGTLVEKEHDGKAYYQDTYWSGNDNRVFGSMQEMLDKGSVEFLCNLDDMEEIEEHQAKYYSKDDVVYLSIHKGYRSKYLIRKGTERSKEAILCGIREKIMDIESNIEYEKRKLESLRKSIEEIELGERQLKHVFF